MNYATRYHSVEIDREDVVVLRSPAAVITEARRRAEEMTANLTDLPPRCKFVLRTDFEPTEMHGGVAFVFGWDVVPLPPITHDDRVQQSRRRWAAYQR